MINFNGTLGTQDSNILTQNRGFLYGDAVFETVKIDHKKSPEFCSGQIYVIKYNFYTEPKRCFKSEI